MLYKHNTKTLEPTGRRTDFTIPRVFYAGSVQRTRIVPLLGPHRTASCLAMPMVPSALIKAVRLGTTEVRPAVERCGTRLEALRVAVLYADVAIFQAPSTHDEVIAAFRWYQVQKSHPNTSDTLSHMMLDLSLATLA